MTEDEERHADEMNIAFQMVAEWERKQSKARIAKLETALREIITHCEVPEPPNARALRLIARKALEGKDE
jgi:DNA-binding transcriptional regulator YiaG